MRKKVRALIDFELICLNCVCVRMCVLFCSNYWCDLWCLCVGKREAEAAIDKEVPVKKLKLESEANQQENAGSSDFEEEQKVQLTTC